MNYSNKIIIEKKLKEYLEEDCNFNDISADCIPDDVIITAKILTKSSGYISGLEETKIFFDLLNVSSTMLKKDGEKVKKGDIVVQLKGNAKNILLGERVALNLLTHMSAITSTVRKFVKIVEDAGKKVRIACTRKTIPGLRIFEKRAIILGGGDPHRFSLDDMILLKDTHLHFYKGDIEKMVKEARKTASFTKKIEIEIEKVEDVIVAAQNGVDIIMLDNMSPEEVEDAVSLLRQQNLRNKVMIEISGGITGENILDYIMVEPDIISIGQLTQFPSEKMDISLRFD